ncbi:MAG TPA: M28 family peptidase [Gemmatimonadales bacterium]|nr:M28 family peptidase [Gemmatimonadales bacterium]
MRLRLLSLLGAGLVAACAPTRTVPETAPPKTDSTPAADAEGPLKHRPAATSPDITAEDLMTRLYIFADDSMQGREAGTAGNVKGTNYIAAEARRMGLTPAGENGTFFQTVPLIIRATDSTSRLEVAGASLTVNRDFLPLPLFPSFLPYGSQLQAENPTALYAGRVGDSLTPAILAQGAGKLVVFGPARDKDGKPTGKLFIHGPPPAVPGAAGVAFATLDLVPKSELAFLRQPQVVVATTVDERRTIPLGLLISSAVARQLFGASVDSLKPGTPGTPVGGQIKFTGTATATPARNVVALLPGSDPRLRGEYVALGAHNDHLGVGADVVDHDSLRLFNTLARPEGDNQSAKPLTSQQSGAIQRQLDRLRGVRPPRPDSIFNGADDDGSGSVTVLEIAEALARGREKPNRSVLFVWHTAEEKGLYGSQWFTDHPTVPRDSIVAQLNMDMVGRGRASDVEGGGPNAVGLVGSRRLSTELGDLIERVNRRRQPAFEIDYRYDANGHPDNIYCRSDHYMYARYGIPIAFFSTGLHRDYHEVTDEPQYIDYEHMARVGDFVRDVALAVANRDHRPVVDHPKPDPNAPCNQ